MYKQLFEQFLNNHKNYIIQYFKLKHKLDEASTALVSHRLNLGRDKFNILKDIHPKGTYAGRDNTNEFYNLFNSRNMKILHLLLQIKLTKRQLTSDETVIISNSASRSRVIVSDILSDISLAMNGVIMRGEFEYPQCFDKCMIRWENGADKRFVLLEF